MKSCAILSPERIRLEPNLPRKSPTTPKSNQIRIVGGQWRGRKLQFPSIDGLRPTGDRIRETLFNWLGQNLAGMRVLDLFAGSGALGIEALSRRAAFAQFVDSDPQAVQHLERSLQTLAAENFDVSQQPAEKFLQSMTPHSVDLLFLDPPFANNQLGIIGKQIDESRILADKALVYIEFPRTEQMSLPDSWRILKSKGAGEVCYQLLQADCGNTSF